MESELKQAMVDYALAVHETAEAHDIALEELFAEPERYAADDIELALLESFSMGYVSCAAEVMGKEPADFVRAAVEEHRGRRKGKPLASRKRALKRGRKR